VRQDGQGDKMTTLAKIIIGERADLLQALAKHRGFLR
jgi:hypothetical protein